MLAGVEVGTGPERGDGGPASIHVGLGFEDPDRQALPAALDFSRTLAPAERPQPPTCGQTIGEAEPGVVPGVLVLRAGIPQPNDRVQGLGFRLGLGLGLALAFRLRLPDEL